MKRSTDYIETMMRQYRAAVLAETNKDTETLERLGTPEEIVRGLLEQIARYRYRD